jgi:hypothetical protein
MLVYHDLQVNIAVISAMAEVFIDGVMAEFTTVTLVKTNAMASESSRGRTVPDTKLNSLADNDNVLLFTSFETVVISWKDGRYHGFG